MIVDRINAYISAEPKPNDELEKEVGEMASYAFKRQFLERKGKDGNLRLSSAGKCARSQAYDFHGFTPEGKEIDSRGRMVFWMGDMVELTVVALAKLSGVEILFTGKDQLSVGFPIGDQVIEGHPDGIVMHEGKKYLLEVKSMTSYGFSEFERGVVNETYLCQINSYMETLGLDACVFVVINKESGVLAERIIPKDSKRVEFVRENLGSVLKSTKDNLPKRAYEPNEKGFYPWQCAYCGHFKTCLVNEGLAERVVVAKAYKLKAKQKGKECSE